MTEDETQRAQMASDAQPESPGRLEIPDALPVLPLRGGTVVFPLAVVPLNVGLERSIRMVDDVMRGNRMLALVAQRGDEPQQAGPEDLYTIGTAAIIHQLMRAPDGTVRLIVQGLERIRLLDFVATEPYLVARVEAAPDRMSPGVETEGLRRAVLDLFRRLVALIPEVPDEVGAAAETVTDPRQVAYLVASTGLLDGAARQEILELEPVEAKLRRLIEILQREESVRELGQQIAAETQGRMTKAQREYFLREQLRSIQQELGEGGDDPEIGRAAAQDRGDDAAGGRAARSGAGAGTAGDDPAGLTGARHHPHLSRLDRGAALGQAERRRDRHRQGAAGPRRRPLRPGEDQGPHPRVPGGAQAAGGSRGGPAGGRAGRPRQCRRRGRRRGRDRARARAERRPRDPGRPRRAGADPPLRRPAGCRQDESGTVDRAGAGPRVRAPQPGRGARRIGDPRSPPDLHRRAPRSHHPGVAARRDARPGLHARRDRQGRLRLAGRPLIRPARSARPGAEPHLPRQLPGGAVRPLAGALHRHREHHRHHPGAAARPHGSHPPLRLHGRGEGADRPEVPRAEAGHRSRPHTRGALHRG